MFRRKILDRLNTPESTDSLLVTVKPNSVMTLASLGLIVIGTLAWSVVAKISINVEGSGILLRPGTVKPVQSTGTGRLTRITVAVGDKVKAGQVIAYIDQPDLQRELDGLYAQYTTKREFADKQIELARRERDLQLAQAREAVIHLGEGIQAIKELRPRVAGRRRELVATQRKQLEDAIAKLRGRRELEQIRLENVEQLVGRGIMNKATQLQLIAQVTQIFLNIAQLEMQLKQTQVSEVDGEQRDLQLRSELASRESDLAGMKIKVEEAKRNFDAVVQQHKETIGGIAAQIRSARERLKRQSEVISPYSGTVLEVIGSEGRLMASGDRIAMMQLDVQAPFYRLELARDASKGNFRLVVNGYQTKKLPVASDGAAIAAALAATPPLKDAAKITATGNASRGPIDIRIVFRGAPNGRRVKIDVDDSKLETARGFPSVAAVTELGADVPATELTHACFFAVGPGKKLHPGLEMRISPANVERPRFGSIVGKVTSVSVFPMTSEGVLNIVGNSKLAQTLLDEGGAIMVEAKLEKDPTNPTGFKWTSKSPDIPMTAGTTTTCRVTVDKRSPISFILPLLREWVLGQRNKPSKTDLQQSKPSG